MKLEFFFSFLIVALLAFPGVNGCSSASEVSTVDQVVKEIVRRANANDTQYIEALLDHPYKNQAAYVIEMIKRSDMLSNYKQRLKPLSDTTARLDYHYLEKGCYFQIDLTRQNANWKVSRIWLCK